jgi:hypothetical protein
MVGTIFIGRFTSFSAICQPQQISESYGSGCADADHRRERYPVFQGPALEPQMFQQNNEKRDRQQQPSQILPPDAAVEQNAPHMRESQAREQYDGAIRYNAFSDVRSAAPGKTANIKGIHNDAQNNGVFNFSSI